ncbi:MAG: hypothetical protein ACOC5U_05090 [Candidatus Aminicenantaceae bacterium]
MNKTELIKDSPLRLLEKSINGGLGRGNIGVFASRKGVGKTACLVHIAIDKLFQDKPVIHVSFSSRVDHIIKWYKDIFREIANRQKLESSTGMHDDIVKNRVIMNFSQAGTSTPQILNSLEALIRYGRFKAETVIVDGFDFSCGTREDLRRFREFADKMNLEVWFSASLKKERELFDEEGIPFELRDFLEGIQVLITLRYQNKHVQLRLAKNHGRSQPEDLQLSLDPATLLIAEATGSSAVPENDQP